VSSKPQAKLLHVVEHPSFFATLYDGKPDDDYVLVWTKDPKTGKKLSKWFTDINEATSYAEKQGALIDTYFGIGLSPREKKSNQRVESSEVAALPCLWADVDYINPVHKKKNLPPTERDAIELVKRMPVQPSLINHTGHGIQAFWLFERVELIESKETREKLATLNEDWNKHLQALALEQGWTVDSTFDLARVFRVPNTKNHKDKDDVVDVRVIHQTNARYKPDELATALKKAATHSAKKPAKSKETIKVGTLALKPDAQVNEAKFKLLCDLEKPKFEASWKRERSEKDMPDQSASSYDLSLATLAAKAGWTDQEIADLMIASRAKHGDDLKLWHETYYPNTIKEARTPSTKSHAKREAARLGMVSSSEKTEQIAEGLVIENFTDVGNAKRLKRLFGGDLRYSKKLKDWLVWDGKRWAEDEELKVNRMAQATAIAIYDEIKLATGEDQRKAIAKHANASEKTTNQRGLLTEARSMLAVRLDTFDTHTYLLNCANGTLDLQTSEWHEHTREHYLTRLAPVDFDASAKCPTWLNFLERIFNDAEMVAFIQRAVGCTLVGESQKREMFLLYGKGSNGKSSLLATLKAMLGDYAATTAVETLMQTKFNNNSADLATLRGSRFVMASESNESQRLNTTLIKKLLGGDTQKVRNLYQSHFEYVPEFRLWFATNYKPQIDPNDDAAWDRVHLIPFDVRIPEREQDKNLSVKLRTELSGILAWAVEGCVAYLRSGLDAPAKVKAATKDYRAEMDTIGDFIEEKCVCGENYVISSTELYQVMAGWLANNGEQEMSQKKFVQELQKRDITTVREAGTGKKMLRGITLRHNVKEEVEQGSEDSHKKKREYMERQERNKILAEKA
jgi:putative DNA primase/helicase